MKQLLHYFRYYLYMFRMSVMRMLAFRSDFFMWTIIHAFELLTNIIFFNIIFLHSGSIGGWNMNQVIVLLGFMEMTLGLGSCTFYPMMYGFNKMIRKGDLDGYLLKPMDTQFLITFPWIDTSDMASIPSGIIIMSYGISRMTNINLPLNILAFVVSLILAELIMYSIIVLLLTLAFRTTTVNYIENFFWNFQWQGRYPATVFKGATYFIFMFIIPIGLVSTVPAQTLFSGFDWKYLMLMATYMGVLLVVSRKLFSKNLERYSSASS